MELQHSEIQFKKLNHIKIEFYSKEQKIAELS